MYHVSAHGFDERMINVHYIIIISNFSDGGKTHFEQHLILYLPNTARWILSCLRHFSSALLFSSFLSNLEPQDFIESEHFALM